MLGSLGPMGAGPKGGPLVPLAGLWPPVLCLRSTMTKYNKGIFSRGSFQPKDYKGFRLILETLPLCIFRGKVIF